MTGSKIAATSMASVALILMLGCENPPGNGAASESRRGSEDSSEPTLPESRPIPQGFTQRPPRGTPGLPGAAPPFLTEEELAEAEATAERVSEEGKIEAQRELSDLIEAFAQKAPELAPEERKSLLTRIRSSARRHVKEGRLAYLTAEALHRAYIFPNEVEKADSRYRGKIVALTGSVAPHSMLDAADGFKVFRRAPYVHEPVLFATDYEFSFVRCHLASPSTQMLRDWQEVHILGVVEGKHQSDVILRHCVVL